MLTQIQKIDIDPKTIDRGVLSMSDEDKTYRHEHTALKSLDRHLKKTRHENVTQYQFVQVAPHAWRMLNVGRVLINRNIVERCLA